MEHKILVQPNTKNFREALKHLVLATLENENKSAFTFASALTEIIISLMDCIFSLLRTLKEVGDVDINPVKQKVTEWFNDNIRKV